MKDYIRETLNKDLPLHINVNLVREYLQKYLLYILYRKKFYLDIVFTGGTSLRLIHGMRRFSEDLDFSLSYESKNYNFEKILKDIKDEFRLAGYDMEIKFNMDKNVHNAFLKFSQLLFNYGLSPHKDEKLSIKIEIDINPPKGGRIDIMLYKYIFMFYIQHYDLSSLFAGKLHALLCREYTKGRDWYDLLWYLTNRRGLEPNYEMLNNAIRQTQKDAIEVTENNWKVLLKEKILELDVIKVRDDVSRFLEDPGETELLTRDNFVRLLG